MKAHLLTALAILASHSQAADFEFPDATIEDAEGKAMFVFKAVTEGDAQKGDLKGYNVVDSEGAQVQFLPYSFGTTRQLDPISFVDFDFDGNADVMLYDEASSTPNDVYEFWRFDRKRNLFVRDKRLEGISSVDEDRELLHSYGRSGSLKVSKTFEWIAGKLALVEVLDVHRAKDGGLDASLSIYKNGKIRKRIVGPDWTAKAEYPYTVEVERYDDNEKLIQRKKEARLGPGG